MDIVRQIEHSATGANDRPVEEIIVADCGEIMPGEDDGIPVPADGDVHPLYPEDYEAQADREIPPNEYLDITEKIKAMGTEFYKKSDFENAEVKYMKAVRYVNAIHPSPESISESEFSTEQKQRFYSLKVSCLLNAALVTYSGSYICLSNRLDEHAIEEMGSGCLNLRAG